MSVPARTWLAERLMEQIRQGIAAGEMATVNPYATCDGSDDFALLALE
ncbi:hypothetical protein Slala02_50610 [Streptomyces lavendulae subsp. lavendulae]|nr:hypothetical protein Slala01_24810 [Streptomyces lavendulae subsp. lavendulae]GLX29241.1 hypothetical protein Slala02_50610 [Streptomyces lavendulae subsp. lavendulae]